MVKVCASDPAATISAVVVSLEVSDATSDEVSMTVSEDVCSAGLPTAQATATLAVASKMPVVSILLLIMMLLFSKCLLHCLELLLIDLTRRKDRKSTRLNSSH